MMVREELRGIAPGRGEPRLRESPRGRSRRARSDVGRDRSPREEEHRNAVAVPKH